MANTTRTQIAREVNNYYDKNLLTRVTPLLVHGRWAQVRDIPAKAGTNTIKFRRYSSLTAATTPLTEGVTPTGSQLAVTDITATVAQYGDYITVTDVVSYESPDAVLTEAGEILGDQAGDTLDILTRDVLAAATGVQFVGTGSTQRVHVANTDVITSAFVDEAVRLLKLNKAKRITRMITPDTGYNTTPIDAGYIAIIHTNISATVQAFTGFIPVEKYPSQRTVMEGEIGAYKNVRFIETTNAKVFENEGESSADVYSTVIFGAEALGVSRISGEAMKNIIKPLGSAGAADPLDQRATSGWKANFVARILNNDFIQRIEHGGPSLSTPSSPREPASRGLPLTQSINPYQMARNNRTTTSPEAAQPAETDVTRMEGEQVSATSEKKPQKLNDRAKETKEALAKEPKMPYIIPLAPGEKAGAYETVCLNSYRLVIKKGVMVELPISVVQILNNYLKVEAEAGQNMRADRDAKVSDALS